MAASPRIAERRAVNQQKEDLESVVNTWMARGWKLAHA
jgi:hypothetical protein